MTDRAEQSETGHDTRPENLTTHQNRHHGESPERDRVPMRDQHTFSDFAMI